MSDNDKDVVVVYHGGCWDGFCAAWLFHRVFPDATYVPGYYGQNPPDDDDEELAACHFVTLCGLIERMGEVGRIEPFVYSGAATVLAKAIEAESHEVIVEVCRIAEAAMREQIAMPERN